MAGRVYDEAGLPVAGAEILAGIKPADYVPAGFVYEGRASSDAEGWYLLRNVPHGFVIQLQASKPGLSRIKAELVLKSGCLGSPDCNNQNFGEPADTLQQALAKHHGSPRDYGVYSSNALTRGVQITAFGTEPVTGVTRFEIGFSAPVERGSFEQNLRILGPSLGCWGLAPDGGNLAETMLLSGLQLSYAWAEDNRSVRVSLPSGASLPPLDREASSCGGYRFDLGRDAQGRPLLRDATGQPASRLLFRRSEFVAHEYIGFGPGDETALQVLRLEAYRGGGLALHFNKPLRYALPGWGSLASGSDGDAGTAPAAIGAIRPGEAAGNYDYEILRGAETLARGNFGQQGWEAEYDGSDAAIVLLRPNAGAPALFAFGDTVRVRPSSRLRDPLGNSFATLENEVGVRID